MDILGYKTLLISLIAAFIARLFLSLWRWIRRGSPAVGTVASDGEKYNEEPTIPAVEGFEWETTEPLQLRPFRGKEKYNLTMAYAHLAPALETLPLPDLIQIDKTYKHRLGIRKRVLEEHHDIVIAVNDTATADPRTHEAVSELYSFVVGTYLPSRYPSMFKIHPPTDGKCEVFEALVTGAEWPTRMSELESPIRALEILAETVDEDFLILLPDRSAPSDQPKYILQAYINCFPSLFNSREKLGLRLADIHGPVPKYAEKLERSMDRFFAKIEVGRAVKRANWSVLTETDLFAAFGYAPDSELRNLKENEAIKPKDLNIDKTVLRCERQTLHRLANTKALVFAFHTYTYPIQQIKDEGLGEELALAIEGLKKGNVPEIHDYKNTDVWGDAVKTFLRS